MGTVIAQTKYEALPAGVYRAKLGAVAAEEGMYGQQLVIRFDLQEEGLTDRSVKAWASAKLSAKSKLYTWVSALLFAGKVLPDDYALDTDDLLDREGLIVLEVVEKDGGQFNRVSSILPLRRGGAKPSAAPVPAPAPATKPPAVTTRAAAPAAQTASRPSDPPDWPEWDESKAQVPAGGGEAEGLPF